MPTELLAGAADGRDFGVRTDDDLYMLYRRYTGKPKGVVWRQEDVWRVLGGGIGGTQVSRSPTSGRWPRPAPRAVNSCASRSRRSSTVDRSGRSSNHCSPGQGRRLSRVRRRETWKIIDRHGVNVVFITGDAMGRLMIEAYEAGDFTCSTLVSIASSAALFSRDDQDRYDGVPQHRRHRRHRVVGNRIRRHERRRQGAEPRRRAPQVKADPETHVLREDGTPVGGGQR